MSSLSTAISRSVVGILLFLAISTNAINVTIYTKDFAPFSNAGKGFSIDFAEEMLKVAFLAEGLSSQVVVLDSVSGVIEAVENFPETSDSMAIGTAGITINVSYPLSTFSFTSLVCVFLPIFSGFSHLYFNFFLEKVVSPPTASLPPPSLHML